MKLKMVYVGSTLSAYGFRLLGSIIRKQFPDCAIRFVVPANVKSILSVVLQRKTRSAALSDKEADAVAKELADTDILGLSSMTEFAEPVKKIIAAVKKINPGVFIVWGGAHALMHPEDAIKYADAVCTSEGEEAFPELIEKFRKGENYKDVCNFWFRDGERIIKNDFARLISSDGLDALPLPVYGESELVYERGKGFVPLTPKHYLAFDALSYNTIWSRGCPFLCTYCANTRLLEIDKDFGKLRHSSVDHMIAEILAAVDRFPYISTIAFYDDCFIALPEDVLRSFAEQMKTRVGLPFDILGVTPVHISRERIRILREGGLNRVRMGIESGSDRLLKFYKRPNRAGLIKEAIDVLGEFADQMVPPNYDIVVDNPIETQEDINDTLRLVNAMPRPFALNIFSLRNMPNTELGRQLAELGTEVDGIENNYHHVRPTYSNALLYIVAMVKIPRPLFEFLLKFTRPYKKSAHLYQPALIFLRTFFYTQRAYHHLRRLDFSVAFGRIGYLLWRWRGLKSRSLVSQSSRRVPVEKLKDWPSTNSPESF